MRVGCGFVLDGDEKRAPLILSSNGTSTITSITSVIHSTADYGSIPGFLVQELGFENDFFDASVDFERFDQFPDESVFGLFEGSVGDHNDRLVGHGAVTGHGNNIWRNLVYVDLLKKKQISILEKYLHLLLN